MKKLAVILSIYILALAILPCMDRQIGYGFQHEKLVQESRESHSSDPDLCSPFCACNCCGSVMDKQNASFQLTLYDLVDFIRSPFSTAASSSPVVAIWQPPELG